MRALTATGHIRRLRLSAVGCLWLLVTGSAAAQPFQFGFTSPAPVELSPPRIDVVSGPTAARLEQARSLAADENWLEAVEVYRSLLSDESHRVVALDDSRYVSLRTYCQLQLAGMPADALAVYRRQVDPLAAQWYRDGMAERDEGLLRRVVEEFYCSSWADDALLALGEIALERADYAMARRAWEQISPLLRSPNGLPPWLALRDIDLSAHWPAVERRWLDRPQPVTWLAYPDTPLDLADLRARLVLVSIRAKERDRAALELDMLRRLHPQAVGRLGGQVGPYAIALERLLTSATEWPAEPHNSDWPTFAGSPSRAADAAPLAPILVPQWSAPVELTPSEPHRATTRMGIGAPLTERLIASEPQVAVRESQRPLNCFPIVSDGAVVFEDAAGIHAIDSTSGEPTITSDGLLYRNEPLDESRSPARFGAAVVHGVPRYTLTAAARVVYGRVGRDATTQLEAAEGAAGDWLVGLDLSRDGLLTFRARPPDASWSFDGVPVCDGRRLYVAMRHSDVTPHAFVACYDASSGSQLWRTPIASADTPAAGIGNEITHNLLTLVGDRVYFSTNLGVVAALDTENGHISWLYRYDRSAGNTSEQSYADRDPSPCMFHEGLLFVAPSDTPAIIALDAHTGQEIWANHELPTGLHLLGVVQHNVIVGGHRLAAVDGRSGRVRFVWPESEHAGIRGMGRGAVAGDEVFWPTRRAIYVVHAVTGQQTRSPLRLHSISDSGANLVAAQGRLIAAGYDKLMAFGPAEAPNP